MYTGKFGKVYIIKGILSSGLPVAIRTFKQPSMNQYNNRKAKRL